MKSELRRKFISLRQSQNEEQASRLSSIIANKLSELKNIHDADCVMVYFAFRGEVNLNSFIDFCLKQGKRICMPKITGEGVMEAVEYLEGCMLKDNKYGIPEPLGTKNIDKKDIDVVIVPAVAFDENFYRLGYGGGYYDRFLRNTDAVKIGVGFDLQITEKLPSEMHDKRMDMVISDKRTLGETDESYSRKIQGQKA